MRDLSTHFLYWVAYKQEVLADVDENDCKNHKK